MTPRSFFDFTLPELSVYLKGLGKESYRAQQLYQWRYQKGVSHFSQMTNLSKLFRSQVGEWLHFDLPKILENRVSRDGTQKFLFAMGKDTVESVLIPSPGRLTLCLSSEVGCNMACKFCFTGTQKMKRRLTAGEIVAQFVLASENSEQRITNIVFMGMGEPLDNAENVFRAVQIFNSPWGLNFSRKKITISTSGILDQFHRVIESGTRLAVSLNGTTDKVRDFLMPINKKWPLEQLLKACREYAEKTRDKVTFEYVLLKGVTDSLEDARRIKKITKDIPCKVNIIPFNEYPQSGFSRPSDDTVRAFHLELQRLGVHVLLRRTMGRDIYAACGQLRSKFEGHPKTLSFAFN